VKSAVVLFYGGPNVGITSLIERRAADYVAEYEWGIGMEFYSERVKVDGEDVNLLMFEIGRENVLEVLEKGLKHGSAVIALVYDVTNPDSLEDAMGFYSDIKPRLHDLPVLLVANKVDDEDSRMVDASTGRSRASMIGAGYIETSAYEPASVDRMLHKLAELAVKKG